MNVYLIETKAQIEQTGIVVQARMGSSRLPNKALLTIRNKTLLERLVERLRTNQWDLPIYIATTVNEKDDILVSEAHVLGCPVFRGSENDVLSRFLKTAKRFNLRYIARVTADNPFTDISSLEQLLLVLWQGNVDYAWNPDLAIGFTVEVFSTDALNRADMLSKEDPVIREHITPIFRQRKDIFSVVDVPADKDLQGSYRLTIDELADWELIKRIILATGEDLEPVSSKYVVELLEKNPEWLSMNCHIKHWLKG